MRISIAAVIGVIFCSPCVVCTAQPPAGAAPPQAAPSAPLTPSGILKPSLEAVQQAVAALKLEKWKKGTFYVDEQSYKMPDWLKGPDLTVFTGIWKGDARLRNEFGAHHASGSTDRYHR